MAITEGEFIQVLDFLNTDAGRALPLKTRLHLMGYKEAREIDGELCALHDFYTTRGIVIGIDNVGIRLRYCYQNREEANHEFAKYMSLDQPPGGNWIKAKGRYKDGRVADDLNPNWSKS